MLKALKLIANNIEHIAFGFTPIMMLCVIVYNLATVSF